MPRAMPSFDVTLTAFFIILSTWLYNLHVKIVNNSRKELMNLFAF